MCVCACVLAERAVQEFSEVQQCIRIHAAEDWQAVLAHLQRPVSTQTAVAVRVACIPPEEAVAVAVWSSPEAAAVPCVDI